MMIRRLNFFWMALVLLWSGTAFSAESIRVMVLPFDVRAQQDFSYLSTQIPKIIQDHLVAEGASIVELPDRETFDPKSGFDNIDVVRGLAARHGADRVIWGQLVVQGKLFQLTARMGDPSGRQPPDEFSASGEGIEALSGIVRAVARDISNKLFQRVQIEEIRVTGNRRIETDAILAVIKTKAGDVFTSKALSDDLKAVYAMGYFEDIRIESEDGAKGKIVRIQVEEKSTIKTISFKGNSAIKDEKLTEALDIKAGSVLNINDVRKNIQRIEVAYKEKKYHNVKVTYKTNELDNNLVDLVFIIEEGEKVQIKEISIVGNNSYPAKKLKNIMKTKEKGFWSWITSAGEYSADVLNQDMALLSAHYHNSGYIKARIADPEVVQKDNWIYITVKLEEGERYKIKGVDVDGELILPKESLLAGLQITKEEYFNREVLRQDMLSLAELYSNFGYAYADASPEVQEDAEKKEVSITYVLTKGDLVYFDKIKIAGNTKTRDKVIRRELEIQEQGLYNGSLLKRSVRNLNRLNYFQDVKVDKVKGEAPDTMSLNINVEEKPTGSFTFGGGYSSVENLFVTASVTQENFLGRGQSLTLKSQVGSTTTQAILGFTEPWLFDIPLSLGTNLYKWTRDYDDYERDSVGGSVMLGYPIYRDTRLFGGYSYDIGDITDVDPVTASQDIIELTGKFITSAVTTGIAFDNRDKIINPSSGQNHRLAFEFAGLGGDIGFTKVTGELGYYHPLFWGTVGFVHMETGVINETSGMTLPDYEKFYLGGMNSVRGFDWRDIHLTELALRDTDYNPLTPKQLVAVEVGGSAMLQGNVEWIIPIAKSAGVVGVIFYDTGNVYESFSDIKLSDLRESTGFGVRWYSPMGPIRIEYGHVLDPKPGESDGRWEFTMGTAF
jgi:outer membrane protein insertion porin family